MGQIGDTMVQQSSLIVLMKKTDTIKIDVRALANFNIA